MSGEDMDFLFLYFRRDVDADEGSAGRLIDYYADMCVEGATARSDNDCGFVHLLGGEIR